MQNLCDIYLPVATSGSHTCFKVLPVIVKGFKNSETASYEGFLGFDIGRIKAVSIIVAFRNHGVAAFSAPVRYRDNVQLSRDEAWGLAKSAVNNTEFDVLEPPLMVSTYPVFWSFRLNRRDRLSDEERSGGSYVYVDRLDGRIWSYEEMIEYHYDYNNLI